MKAEQRLWRTGDGGLVLDGDPAGESLAYTPGDDIAPRDESLVPGQDPAGDPAEEKSGKTDDGQVKAAAKQQARRPANKAAQPEDDK
ncbi:hypothetical protein [Herbidospora sp. RD11066]